MVQREIAVIGGGIAGLGSAWLLSRRYDVTLFERNDYIGGHSNTVDAPAGAGESTPVDTGFIVYNEPNYPHLSGLFRHLDVPTRASDMSFAFSCTEADVEYAGDNLNTLFAQRRNLLRPRFWRMAGDVLRFNADARRRLGAGMTEDLTLGAYLEGLGVSRAFMEHYLLPMSAAIWSCPQSRMLDFPAIRFLRFFEKHGLISLTNRPPWRTVRGGSREYVRRMTGGISRVVSDTPVRRVVRGAEGVTLHGEQGLLGRFDEVVVAAHADEALAMLEAPTEDERRVLGGFRYQPNEAVLHTDPAAMPRRRSVWSSWNHLSEGFDGNRPVAVTYWMNRLQGLETREPLFVTLNPLSPPDPAKVIRRMTYDHPVFDLAACNAQRLLPTIQGRDRIWFAGSYAGYGFHEDALASAVRVASALGVSAPWQQQPEPETAPAVTGNPVEALP
ncbi:FAD-dependent oxidoreductase [Ectothiorhodospiraceae bacterium WFHF3C12]|nr:FAD-dependent oxidoreductase [Ectothiorhodospiraceae bacterium WFHF3C12]